MFDPKNIRPEFPILNREINGKPLVYFDNAATTQKPKQVIESLKNFYENHNANVHRGFHSLSAEATDMFEATRENVRKFINAKETSEIIFTKNATESINLVMNSFVKNIVSEGDEIIVSILEHHSNFVPWQQIANLKIIPLSFPLKQESISEIDLDFETYKKLFTEKTKFIALTGMSNALGVIPDIKKFIDFAKEKNIPILIDATQLAAHSIVDVQGLNPDFLVFSAHKMLGPTGVGVLYAKKEHHEKMTPFNYGGDMIKKVTKEETIFTDSPTKFEAGTPNIADVVAFGEAIKYLENIGMENIHSHEQELRKLGVEILSKFPEVTIYGNENSGGIISFNIEGVHAHDVASIFDSHGIAIRSGHHCAEPLMNELGVSSTARLSFYLYNTKEEVLKIEEAIKNVINIFKK